MVSSENPKLYSTILAVPRHKFTLPNLLIHHFLTYIQFKFIFIEILQIYNIC